MCFPRFDSMPRGSHEHESGVRYDWAKDNGGHQLLLFQT